MSVKLRCGFVTLMGRPNVGKSTLINTLLREKVSIVSSVPQTTRFRIRGILTTDSFQIVFVDTPGLHLFKDSLASYLNNIAKKGIEDTDVILYLVDVTRSVGKEEMEIMKFLLKCSCSPIIMGLNKIDLGYDFLNQYIKIWEELVEENKKVNPVKFYIPISAKTGKNLDRLINTLVDFLPQQEFLFYPQKETTDFPLNFRISEVIREKLLYSLKEEIPHQCAVVVDEVREKEKITYIHAYIYVNRVSQKKIIIGKDASFIKKIGVEARADLESLLRKKVYLELEVKVIKDWQKKIRILKELGYE
ncbi:MAG: GTPase Era [Candidatus Omnitrophica bacterium 4484_70.1]|nr:MAG: GTPase Era [Candidatus Omnitrophica bacterium 4484_70.1]